MTLAVVVAWLLTAVFAVLVLPCVRRLVRLDYVHLGPAVRNGDLAELLLVVAMIAMASPVGAPIPAAGWQAILVLTTGWFAFAWWRSRAEAGLHAGGCGHHALSAAAMLYLVSAMPHGDMVHGPWLTMSTAETGLALPVLAIGGAVYFAADAVRSGFLAVRTRGRYSPGFTSRTVCRAVMGAGMGYMLLAAL
ncbi:DUF5134 domain-containing protein [Amycolatopsis saalfeldensis]|uniref:DUF5134 domain-containing protein n=1 Tax=Amycolatopsis saalfeldensis TaxID=394193 RepID=A0A1H8X4R6_9PSEU|nr:DUF5134 domain-containing protein [Amycolatopsis saalfeldensis]SEP34930.1 hypothetical protein SAMN04489732_106283 [Amycolatopsis saalfeldensis]